MQIPARDITGETGYPVRIEGIVNADVRAKIAGYITQVLVDEGARVQEGQPLFRLETRTLSEDAQAAQANVDAAQVAVDQLQPLVAKHIIGPSQLEAAKAKLAQAKADHKSITANIGYASINSPISGYVGRIPYRQGSLVDPSSPLPLTTVSNTSEVYAYFSMNEADYIDFLQHTPGGTLGEKITHFPDVKLVMANDEAYAHAGKITTVTAQVDPGTGTVSFRATFPNPEHLIAYGSSGTLLIPRLHKAAVVVPSASTYEQQGLTYAFRVLKDSTVTPVILQVADRIGNTLVVRSGLAAGDAIVAEGAGKLHDKDKIIPVPRAFSSLTDSIKPIFQ
ncbi:MAG: efflux RND transporter periplasmic adaptor subunit [Bacteroidetes bacterium]|nr:efflux RND transporter periplasmic adaptor subunit [Bacteroidota bacterium]